MAANDSNSKLGFAKKSVSIESTASLTSSGNESVRSSSPGTHEQWADEDLPGLYNAAGALLFCPRHRKYGLEKIATKSGLKDGLWFPHSYVNPNETFVNTIKKKLNSALAAPGTKAPKGHLQFHEPQLIEIENVQLPGIEKWIKRMIFKVRINVDNQPTYCCNNVPGLTWLDQADIEDGADGAAYWGPEPTYLHHASVAGILNKIIITDLPLDSVLKESNQVIRHAAGYSDDDVMRIYSEFTQHVYPSRFMNYKAFENYTVKAGLIDLNEAQSFFRAFAFEGTHFLSFQEFLLGLAAGDPGTRHEAEAGQFRTGYILRFYDNDRDQLLRREELVRMVADIHMVKKKQSDQSAIEKEVDEVLKSMQVGPEDSMTFEQALAAIGGLKLRGTASLFRFKKSFQGAAKIPFILYPIIDEHFETIVGGKKSETKCPKCEQLHYVYGEHVPILTVDGVKEVTKISSGNEDVTKKSEAARRLSDFQFANDSISNTVLDWIRDLSEVNKVLTNTTRLPKFQKGKAKSFYTMDKKVTVAAMVELCETVERMMQIEARMLKIKSPVTVFGGIHGNLHDLMLFERQFWRKGPMLEASSFLFLGDYIGESKYNLEVVLYLFALKALAPHKVFLLRGNTEIRATQGTLLKESEEKLGQDAQLVWDKINRAYDSMPMCALVDKGVFLSNGGLPKSASKLEEFSAIPCPLSDPETQSPVAWELLWNEPVSATELTTLKAKPAKGFILNTRNGNKGFLFTDTAVSAFLKSNKLTHLVRTHNGTGERGLVYSSNAHLINLVSCTNHEGKGNKACVIFLNRGKVRGIQVDTSVL
ncbi:Serine/threonine-protein phosphatase BSL3 [Halotydeus destructor]|nr:Serine/threonine-protein phosphatase BSL3 [Halotydeus destructor]